MSAKTYEVTLEPMGYLVKQDVVVVHVPRADFMQVVADTFDYMEGRRTDAETLARLREKLTPVAEKMPTFPLRTWLNTERGCGCVVGEYLIAADIIERTPDGVRVDVWSELNKVEDGEALRDFGSVVDENVYDAFVGDANLVYAEDVDGDLRLRPRAILIED